MINPVFTEDFSLVVTDNGIYNYTNPTANTPGIYKLDVVETFDKDKKIRKYLNNYIVFSKKSISSNNYAWKVHIYKIINSTSVKINYF